MPPAIISGPRRLRGRRHHATTPATTYGALIHSKSRSFCGVTSSATSPRVVVATTIAIPMAAVADSVRVDGTRSAAGTPERKPRHSTFAVAPSLVAPNPPYAVREAATKTWTVSGLDRLDSAGERRVPARPDPKLGKDDSGVEQTWDASGVGCSVVHLHDTVYAKACLHELVDVGAEWPMVCVCREPIDRDLLGVALVEEIVRHDLDVAAIARVDDREDEPASVPEHSCDGVNRRCQIGDVHERHVADDAVEAPIGKRR